MLGFVHESISSPRSSPFDVVWMLTASAVFCALLFVPYGIAQTFVWGIPVSVGNREAMTTTGEVVTYTYDAANRLTSVGDVSYTCDERGNPSG